MFLWGIRMATLGIPNLCGANPDQENVLNKLNDLVDSATANLNAEAAAAVSELQGKLDEVSAELKKLVPELPSLPPTNLQAEITSLLALTPTSLTYASQLAKITSDFGDALTEKGLSLDTLLKDGLTKITSGGDVCGLVPNLEIESGATEVKEKAMPAGLASTAPTKEVASVLNTAISIATKANAAMEERAKTATTAGGAMEALIASTVGAIDRDGGTVSPSQITEMKKLDTNVKNSIFGSGTISWPAINKALDSTDTNQSFESDIVTEGDKVDADNGNVNEMPAEDDTNKFSNEKKSTFHKVDKAFEKYVKETKHAENELIRANASKGYPHNVVGTSSLDAKKMYVIPPKDKTLGEASRFGNYNYKAYVYLINEDYNRKVKWREEIKRDWNRGFIEDDSLKYGRPMKDKNPTLKKNIIDSAKSYVESCEESISAINVYHKDVKQLMEVPIKQPEATKRDSHVPVRKNVGHNSSRMRRPPPTVDDKELIAKLEKELAAEAGGSLDIYRLKNHRGRRYASVKLGKQYDNIKWSGIHHTSEGAVRAAIRNGISGWTRKQAATEE